MLSDFFTELLFSAFLLRKRFQGREYMRCTISGVWDCTQNSARPINRTSYSVPIYVGKAVPPGWRQSRTQSINAQTTSLYNRLKQHVKSIGETRNLSIEDFACRFMIFEGDSQNMIAAVEAAIIAEKTPIWNSVIDGFGNHDPGAKRKSGRLSAWDALHPGRVWTERLSGESPDVKELKRRITDYLVGLR